MADPLEGYLGEGIPGIRVRQDKTLEETAPAFGEVMGAQFEETSENNPLRALERIEELGWADMEVRKTGTFGREIVQRPKMDAAAARARVDEAGVKLTIPDDGITETALDILINRKIAENRRLDVLNRSSGDIGTGASRIGVAVAASLLDPLNIATAFVPVVGPTRYAGMVAKAAGGFERAAIRAGVGMAEGAAGAALVEPLIYAANAQQQADYDLTDSLLNVAFGTALGGGLHTVGGAVADWRLRRSLPEGVVPPPTAAAPQGELPLGGVAREPVASEIMSPLRMAETARALPEPIAADLRASGSRIAGTLASDMEGAKLGMDVARLADQADSAARRELTSLLPDIEAALTRVGGEGLDDLKRALDADIVTGARQAALDSLGPLRERGADARAMADDLTAMVSRGASDEEISARLGDLDALAARQPIGDAPTAIRSYLEAKRDAQLGLLADAITEIGRRGLTPEGMAALSRIGERARRLGINMPEVAPAIMESVSPATREAALRSAVAQINAGQPVDIQGLVMADPAMRAMPALQDGAPQLVRDAAVRQGTPENSRVADFEASRQADERLKDAPKMDAPEAPEGALAEAQAALDNAMAGLDPEIQARVREELAPYDRLIVSADDIGRAVRAAANCALRKI